MKDLYYFCESKEWHCNILLHGRKEEKNIIYYQSNIWHAEQRADIEVD